MLEFKTVVFLWCTVLILFALGGATPSASGVKDTIDMAVGSGRLNTTSMVSHQTHTRASWVASGAAAEMRLEPEVLNARRV